MSATGGRIPGIPEACRVDEACYRKICDGRETLLEVLKECSTYGGMAREMRLARDSVHPIDKYFYLEDFFVQQVPSLVQKLVFDKVLGALPGGELNALDASNVIGRAETAYKEITAIHASAMVRHSLPTLAKAVNGAMMIVKAMLDGESLTDKASSKSSEFHRLVHQRCASTCIYEYQKPVKMNGEMVKFLYGTAAVKKHIEKVDTRVANSQPVDLAGLKLFRQYRWLMTSEEDVRIQKMIMDERRKRQNFLEGRMLKDAGAAELAEGPTSRKGSGQLVSAGVPAVGGRSRASGSSAGPTPSSSSASAAATQPPQKKVKVDPEMDAKMALFFSQKARASSS